MLHCTAKSQDSAICLKKSLSFAINANELHDQGDDQEDDQRDG